MVKPKTYAGEPEILALVHVIKRPIAVHYQSSPDKGTIFGDAYKDSAQTIHVLNYPDSNGPPGHYDLLVCSKKQAKAKDFPNPGSYVIKRHGKRRWYPRLILNVDPEANDVEVKFMYPSGKGRNKFIFGAADLVLCAAENIVLVCDTPMCNNKELYSFKDDIIDKVDLLIYA